MPNQEANGLHKNKISCSYCSPSLVSIRIGNFGYFRIRDVIVATALDQYPNAILDMLSLPYIFRGALDVRATRITEGMLITAAKYGGPMLMGTRLPCHLMQYGARVEEIVNIATVGIVEAAATRNS